MPRFLVTIYHADDYDPSAEDAEMGRAIDALNAEMVAAGIRVFVGGLHHANTARSLRPQPSGEVRVSAGSYLPTTEHIGGLWVLEAPDLATAEEWGRKAALACRTAVEVRQFH